LTIPVGAIAISDPVEVKMPALTDVGVSEPPLQHRSHP
jgi:hypothetical protein